MHKLRRTRFLLSSPCLYIVIVYFSTKEAQPEEDPSVAARLQRLQNNYEDYGMRRTVEGVLVVHDHGHPHILMLQIANAFFKLCVLILKPVAIYTALKRHEFWPLL